jgi:hypothetical protein
MGSLLAVQLTSAKNINSGKKVNGFNIILSKRLCKRRSVKMQNYGFRIAGDSWHKKAFHESVK